MHTSQTGANLPVEILDCWLTTPGSTLLVISNRISDKRKDKMVQEKKEKEPVKNEKRSHIPTYSCIFSIREQKNVEENS